MAKRPSSVKQDHHELLCLILRRLDILEENVRYRLVQIDLKTQHLLQHAHHLEELIVALSGDASNQLTIKSILDKSASSRAKLAQALAEPVPSAPTPGTLPS